MIKDAHDLPLSTAHASTVAAYDKYAADWIGYGTQVRSIFTAADADPDCAYVNAHAAAVHMALEASSGFRKARLHLTRARNGDLRLTETERVERRRSGRALREQPLTIDGVEGGHVPSRGARFAPPQLRT